MLFYLDRIELHFCTLPFTKHTTLATTRTMSQSKTKFDSTKIKETVRLKCSKAISNKILATGLFVFLTGLIVAAVCFVLIVGNKSPDNEGKQPL